MHLQWTGAVIDLFSVNRSKPGWSFGTWDSSHVQDWQEQVWVDCTELDSEVCHGLKVISIKKIKICRNFYVWFNRQSLYPFLKCLKTGRNEVCPVLKKQKNMIIFVKLETENLSGVSVFVVELWFDVFLVWWDEPPNSSTLLSDYYILQVYYCMP